jgi:hypothetical protein
LIPKGRAIEGTCEIDHSCIRFADAKNEKIKIPNQKKFTGAHQGEVIERQRMSHPSDNRSLWPE